MLSYLKRRNGLTKLAIWLPKQEMQRHNYQHSEIGYNYRMSNIAAGIGRGQMKVLDKWVEYRRANHDFYFKELNSLGFEFLKGT